VKVKKEPPNPDPLLVTRGPEEYLEEVSKYLESKLKLAARRGERIKGHGPHLCHMHLRKRSLFPSQGMHGKKRTPKGNSKRDTQKERGSLRARTQAAGASSMVVAHFLSERKEEKWGPSGKKEVATGLRGGPKVKQGPDTGKKGDQEKACV